MNADLSVAGASPLRSLLVRAIAVGVVFGCVFTAFGSFGPFNDAEFSRTNFLEWLISVGAIVIAAAVVWVAGKGGTVTGNASGASTRALIFGAVTLISFPVFWLGLYPAFAAGSFVLGGSAMRDAKPSTRTKAIVGLALAGLGTVFCAVLNLFG